MRGESVSKILVRIACFYRYTGYIWYNIVYNVLILAVCTVNYLKFSAKKGSSHI